MPPDVRALVSEISDLLLAADAGSLDAETQLYGRYASDPRLHPGEEVTQFSPFGDPPVHVARRRRTSPVEGAQPVSEHLCELGKPG